ncbi:MAG: DUF58 domain-containing protein [Geminicoccaceae bacterium]|nr:MAG: DUF58 domain-containing protein [Geminicoccaceae bacterium]
MTPQARTLRRHEAEKIGASLPPLLVAAERVAATVAQGVHGRRRVGMGESFWQFRPYQAGDSTAAIDWRQSAKGDRVVLRELEWEAAQSVWLWVDPSPSMRYASKPGPTKHDRAQVLALALASLLLRAGERVASLAAGTPPMAGRAALARLADQLDGDPGQRFPRRPLPRHARAVLISDWLAPLDATERWLRDIHAMGVKGFALLVLDPAEIDLPFSGRVRFKGLGDEGMALIGNVDRVRGDYAKLLANHRAALADTTRRLGWSLTLHRTDHPPEQALLPAFMALGGGGRS